MLQRPIEVHAEPIGPVPPHAPARRPSPLRWIPGSATVIALVRFLLDDDAPTTKRFLTLLSLIYLISPMDFIPDWFIPLLGFADDAAVFWALLSFIGSEEMKPYKAWARAWLRGSADNPKPGE